MLRLQHLLDDPSYFIQRRTQGIMAHKGVSKTNLIIKVAALEPRHRNDRVESIVNATHVTTGGFVFFPTNNRFSNLRHYCTVNEHYI